MFALALGLMACGKGREFLLVVRDSANRPLARIEVRDAQTGALLGSTDETGSVRFTPSKGRRETFRVRLRTADESLHYEFEDPIALTDADLRQGARLVRARSNSPADSVEGRAVLAVETDPPGATVVLNDRAVGSSSVVVRDLEPGRVQVELRLAGYETHAVDLLLLEGENRYVWELRRKGVNEVPSSLGTPSAATPGAIATTPPVSSPATGAAAPELGAGPKSEPTPGPATSSATGAAEAASRGPTADPLPPAAKPHEEKAPDIGEVDRPAIVEVLERYATALERRDLDGYAELWTQLSDENRRKLRAAFDDLASQEVELRDLAITVTRPTATVRFLEVRAMKFRAGRDQRLERALVASFSQDAKGRWRLDQIRSTN